MNPMYSNIIRIFASPFHLLKHFGTRSNRKSLLAVPHKVLNYMEVNIILGTMHTLFQVKRRGTESYLSPFVLMTLAGTLFNFYTHSHWIFGIGISNIVYNKFGMFLVRKMAESSEERALAQSVSLCAWFFIRFSVPSNSPSLSDYFSLFYPSVCGAGAWYFHLLANENDHMHRNKLWKTCVQAVTYKIYQPDQTPARRQLGGRCR